MQGKPMHLTHIIISNIRKNLSVANKLLQSIFGIPKFSRLSQANNAHFPDTVLSDNYRPQTELQLFNTKFTSKELFSIIKNTQNIYI
jgi:hypothetical protein